ncbi:uncharacterized protein LOC122005937 isoform X1 [Zingiber officinale]|uniref:Uncharacterized protein n=1 Tax=Zingiber officinale TaxID=94328 RepID=A0A8J5FM18_ZINOF|nr:uncharacterized protein LOC122005937 isoform X1 [Zingiber officinale]KAG6489758.1 hypothetical protein ZIOFF_051037 [Zingiber officinale]
MAEEDDVRLEVEAVLAVYGGDCRVIREFPPHLAVHIRPRTADDSSQQFVEVILGIKSTTQYPSVPPHIYIIDEKGLDESRQAYLITGVQNKAIELRSCSMLVALCEEAVDLLSNMNHPEGNCPLCLYPLVAEDQSDSTMPFMKLMSCYHCFHNECIIGWWKWLQTEDSEAIAEISSSNPQRKRDTFGVSVEMNQLKGTCPVCRKIFDKKDIVHVHEYPETDSLSSGFAGIEVDEDTSLLLHSESENNRRRHFETLLKLQSDKNGLIQPKKDLAILPGMYLPEVAMVPITSAASSAEPPTIPPTASAGTSNKPGKDDDHEIKEKESRNSANKVTTSKWKTAIARKGGKYNPRPHQANKQQWVRKGFNTFEQ